MSSLDKTKLGYLKGLSDYIPLPPEDPEAIFAPPPPETRVVGKFTPTPDMVRKPPHYAALSPEPLDVLLQWKLGFAESNAVKYIVRAGRKGGPEKRREDLEKAIYYLQRLIASEETK